MVIVVADTTAGLPRETCQQLGIPLVPQIVIFGETFYRDDTELNTDMFLEKLKAARTLPKTAAPPPMYYNEIYEKAGKDSDTVIVVAPSAKVSGTVRAATVAAKDYPGVDVRVVDSATIAGNLGSLVLMAHAWAKAGLSADAMTKHGREYGYDQLRCFPSDRVECILAGFQRILAHRILGPFRAGNRDA